MTEPALYKYLMGLRNCAVVAPSKLPYWSTSDLQAAARIARKHGDGGRHGIGEVERVCRRELARRGCK